MRKPCGEIFYNSQPKSLAQKYKKIAQIVRENPGISAGEIHRIYYGDSNHPNSRKRLQGMLLQCCFDKRIECIDMNYYPVEEST